jgi:VWFA-related protein
MSRLLRLAAVAVAVAALLNQGTHAQNSQGAQGGTQGAQPAQGGSQQGTQGAPASTPNPQGDQQPTGATPTFRGGINFVRVDVIVSDKTGNPVGDLKQSDFEVVEDGKPQAIETFKLIQLDGGLMPGPDGPPRQIRTDSDEELEASRDDVRLFGIFLDDYHVRAGTSMATRQSVARFIETQLGPSDMIGMMYPLQPVSTIRFTRNHDAISQGIQQFLGRKYDYTPKNPIEEKYAYYPTETVERIRNQVSLSAIEGMIVHMGTLKEGRKALLLVSEGYTNMLPPQLRNPVAGLPGFGNPAANNPMAGQNDPNEDRAAFFANTDLQNDLREVFTAANRNNVAIYAIDPRGLATNEFDIDQNIGGKLDRDYLASTMDTLRQLSEESDGRAIVNRNDITVAMKQIVRDSSAYYLLGYTSTTGANDGKFHDIKVRVKRPGVQVRSRKGYWALTTEDVKRALAPPKEGPPKAVESALAAISTPSRARIVRTWIGTDKGQNGKTRVTFVWEPTPKTPGEQARPSDSPARVTLLAATEDGAPVFRGRVPDTMPVGASSPQASRVTFDAPPGKLSLRVAVEGTGAETLDSEVRELSIPDLTAPQTTFGTPQLFRVRNARDAQLVKSDAAAIPTTTREFNRSERMIVKIITYGPGTTPAAVTARLLNRTGQPMNDVPVTAAADGPSLIDLSLAGLAPGEYLLELSANGSGGEAKELVGFRIAG